MLPLPDQQSVISRRQLFSRSACGIGTAALASLLNPAMNQVRADEPKGRSGVLAQTHFPVKAKRLIEQCRVCLYAGSLVPEAVVAFAPEGAIVKDTAVMTLDDTHAEILAAQARGEDVDHAVDSKLGQIHAPGHTFPVDALRQILRARLSIRRVSRRIPCRVGVYSCRLTDLALSCVAQAAVGR